MGMVSLSTAAESFNLSYCRFLLTPKAYARATNRLPYLIDCMYSRRVAGRVTVMTPDGEITSARAYEARTLEEVPPRVFAHGVLNGLTYWFQCSSSQRRRDVMDVFCYRAYFFLEGKWLFFYTEGGMLPFGAVVNFESTRSSHVEPAGLMEAPALA